jgi:hypothetical protein
LAVNIQIVIEQLKRFANDSKNNEEIYRLTNNLAMMLSNIERNPNNPLTPSVLRNIVKWINKKEYAEVKSGEILLIDVLYNALTSIAKPINEKCFASLEEIDKKNAFVTSIPPYYQFDILSLVRFLKEKALATPYASDREIYVNPYTNFPFADADIESIKTCAQLHGIDLTKLIASIRIERTQSQIPQRNFSLHFFPSLPPLVDHHHQMDTANARQEVRELSSNQQQVMVATGLTSAEVQQVNSNTYKDTLIYLHMKRVPSDALRIIAREISSLPDTVYLGEALESLMLRHRQMDAASAMQEVRGLSDDQLNAITTGLTRAEVQQVNCYFYARALVYLHAKRLPLDALRIIAREISSLPNGTYLGEALESLMLRHHQMDAASAMQEIRELPSSHQLSAITTGLTRAEVQQVNSYFYARALVCLHGNRVPLDALRIIAREISSLPNFVYLGEALESLMLRHHQMDAASAMQEVRGLSDNQLRVITTGLTRAEVQQVNLRVYADALIYLHLRVSLNALRIIAREISSLPNCLYLGEALESLMLRHHQMDATSAMQEVRGLSDDQLRAIATGLTRAEVEVQQVNSDSYFYTNTM